MRFAELERTLAEHGQMLPLDPGWGEESTVGGVIAANLEAGLGAESGKAVRGARDEEGIRSLHISMIAEIWNYVKP